MSNIAQPSEISIITTYRCPISCSLCDNNLQNCADKSNEITTSEIEKLPKVDLINLTGIEPFNREDLNELVRVCFTKSSHVVITTTGWYEDRILMLAREFPDIGIRINIDGLRCQNIEIQSQQGGSKKIIGTLKRLKKMGIKDIRVEYSLKETNTGEMLSFYRLFNSLGIKFKPEVDHKSYYLYNENEKPANRDGIISNLEKLIAMQMKEIHPRSWFNAFYNLGLINYLEGNRSMLPCEAGIVNCFVDPYGEVYPCNAFEESSELKSMGNIRKTSDFKELWESEKAQKVRRMTRKCQKNCWMGCTAIPVMRKYKMHPTLWVLKNKIQSIQGKPLKLDNRYYNVGQNPKQGDLKKAYTPKIVVTGTRGIPNILGGVETHCEELFPRIVQEDFDVTVIRRKNYIRDNLNDFRGVHLIDVVTPQKKSFEAIIHTFKAILVVKFKYHADMIHIHAVGPALLTPFARLIGLKVVFTHHGADYEREKWGKIAKLIIKMGERMGVKYANEMIVISEVINSDIKRKYGRTDAHLIYNGVNIPVKSSDTTYIDTLGIKKGKYVFAMGRFVPEKGFDLLIRVFEALKLKDIQLVIAGDTDHADEYSINLKKQAAKSNVILTGFIKGEKLNELLTNARLFVLPSYHEGLPIALLEAMSYNLDVLASNIPANKAVNLPTECYFENKNADDFFVKLSNKLAVEALKREYDLSAYNWDNIAEETAEVYVDTL